MIVRDVRKSDLASVHRLIGQLGYPTDPLEFQARFERVAATLDHRIFVAEEDGRVVGVLHAFVRPALEKPCEVVVQALVVEAIQAGAKDFVAARAADVDTSHDASCCRTETPNELGQHHLDLRARVARFKSCIEQISQRSFGGRER